MERRLYIAYGSNLNIKQMEQRCPTAKLIGTSVVKDYEMLFNGVATIEKKRGSVVPVGVWELKEDDEMSLDAYEGFPRLYKKQDFKIELEGEEVEVMAYVMTKGHSYRSPLPSYYNVIYQGYIDNNLDTKILEKALERTKELERKEIEEGNKTRHSMGWW